MRWQYLGQVFSIKNNVSSFYPERYDPSLCSLAAFTPDGMIDPTLCDVQNGIVTQKSPGVNKSLREPHYKDFEPRVGVAWSPLANHRLVVRVGGGIYHGRDAFSQNSATRQFPFNNFPSLNNVSFSSLTAFDPNTPQPPRFLNVLDKNYPNPAEFQYSAGVQYEIMRNTGLEINYVGGQQIHIGRNVNINQVPASAQLGVANFLNNTDPVTGDPCDPTIPTCIDPNTVRPFLGYGVINRNERAATSRYNSLQVLFNRQMSHGLAFQAAYAYSRNIGNTSNQDSEARFRPIQDFFHPNNEKGVTDSDIPHSLVMNYVWELPFFQKSEGLKKAVLGGWQVNGIMTFRSGRPVNICLPNDNAGLGDGDVCERRTSLRIPSLTIEADYR